jgi:hypothetical protein
VQGRSQDTGGSGKGDGPGALCGQCSGCPQLLRACRLPSSGSTTVKRAVSVLCWGGICGLRSLEAGLLNPRNAPELDHKLGPPEA